MKHGISARNMQNIHKDIFSKGNLVYSAPSVYGPPLPVFEAITFVLSEH